MTGAGAPGGPGILQCLRRDHRINLLVGDADSNASGRYLHDQFVLLPRASDPNFISIFREICLKYKIDLIYPLVTRELFELSRNLDHLENIGTKVVVSNYLSLSIANDKIALYEHLSKYNIQLPEFRVAYTFEDLKKHALDLGYPDTPVVIKPGISNGSRGIRILDTKKNRYQLLFDEKPNSLYSSLEEIEVAVGGRSIPPMLISEFLPGEELTVDSIIVKGKVKLILIRTRDKMNGGISTAGRFIINDMVHQSCENILKTLELSGPIGLQFKMSKNGEYKLLEINPRIQGTSVAAMGLGINLPVLSLSEFTGWDDPIPTKRNGIGFSRFYSEAYYETL